MFLVLVLKNAFRKTPTRRDKRHITTTSEVSELDQWKLNFMGQRHASAHFQRLVNDRLKAATKVYSRYADDILAGPKRTPEDDIRLTHETDLRIVLDLHQRVKLLMHPREAKTSVAVVELRGHALGDRNRRRAPGRLITPERWK